MASRRRKRKKQHKGKAGVVVVVCMLVGFMAFRIVNLYHQKEDYTQKASALSEQIKEEQSRQEELESYEKYVQTDEYVEKVAQSKLGLVYDNEIVFKEKTEKN